MTAPSLRKTDQFSRRITQPGWRVGCVTKLLDGIECGVHLYVHHKSTRSPLPAKLRIRHRHIQLLAAGDVALIAPCGARDGTANADSHHQHSGEDSDLVVVETTSSIATILLPCGGGLYRAPLRSSGRRGFPPPWTGRRGSGSQQFRCAGQAHGVIQNPAIRVVAQLACLGGAGESFLLIQSRSDGGCNRLEAGRHGRQPAHGSVVERFERSCRSIGTHCLDPGRGELIGVWYEPPVISREL